MKIAICTTPIRPVPTTYPPFGSLAIIQSLKEIDEYPEFYNIDYFRYSHSEISAFFKEGQFDIVGISAVVSTAYAYVKYLTELIRQVSPGTVIILGGGLAASAEILLRKTSVDYCVIGDGEYIIKELVSYLNVENFSKNHEKLKKIQGIAYLTNDSSFIFTGFGIRPAANEITWPDYSILELDGSIDYLFPRLPL